MIHIIVSQPINHQQHECIYDTNTLVLLPTRVRFDFITKQQVNERLLFYYTFICLFPVSTTTKQEPRETGTVVDIKLS